MNQEKLTISKAEAVGLLKQLRTAVEDQDVRQHGAYKYVMCIGAKTPPFGVLVFDTLGDAISLVQRWTQRDKADELICDIEHGANTTTIRMMDMATEIVTSYEIVTAIYMA